MQRLHLSSPHHAHSRPSPWLGSARLGPAWLAAASCLRTSPITPSGGRGGEEMIQHAVHRRCLHVGCCLPRGLESCRYGGAVGVTFPELGLDSSWDRSSMPSEAMTFGAEGRGLEGGDADAPGCTAESSRSAGCFWCRAAPGPAAAAAAPVTAAWWRRSSAAAPAPHWLRLGAPCVIWTLWWNFCMASFI